MSNIEFKPLRYRIFEKIVGLDERHTVVDGYAFELPECPGARLCVHQESPISWRVGNYETGYGIGHSAFTRDQAVESARKVMQKYWPDVYLKCVADAEKKIAEYAERTGCGDRLKEPA